MALQSHQKPAKTPLSTSEGKDSISIFSKPLKASLIASQVIPPVLLNRLACVKWFNFDPMPGTSNSQIMEERIKVAVNYRRATIDGKMALGDPYPGSLIASIEPYFASLFIIENLVRSKK